MNLIIIAIMAMYLIGTGYFLYKFFQNNMSLKDTLADIKSCCIKNKKKIKEKIGEEKTKEIVKNMKELDGDCKEPVGFPFDICFNGELEKEDIILREKLMKILKNRKNVVFDGGKEKLVVPLEATLFLTKSLNPLVNEHGEIQIVAKHKQLSKKLKEVIMLLKNKGEIIYEDEKELLNSIKTLIEEVDDSKIIPKKHKNIVQAKEEKMESIEPVEEILPEQEFFPPEEELKKQITKEAAEIVPEQEFFPPEEAKSPETRSKPENKKQTVERKITSSIKEDPFGDNSLIEDSPFGEEDNSLDLNDLNSLLEEELADLDFGEEEETTDIIGFYKDLEYKTAKAPKIDFENIEESIKKVLNKDNVVSTFFKNLAKTTPIIFNDNKEIAFIDQFNIYFAIAKIYGLDSKKYIDNFKSLKLKEIQKLNKGLAIALELYLSDIRTGKLESSKEVIEKEGELFYSFGFNFQTKAFKTGLSQEEFDFFRSFPYNNEYKLKGNISISEKLPRLVNSIEEVEIK